MPHRPREEQVRRAVAGSGTQPRSPPRHARWSL